MLAEGRAVLELALEHARFARDELDHLAYTHARGAAVRVLSLTLTLPLTLTLTLPLPLPLALALTLTLSLTRWRRACTALLTLSY